MSHPTEHLLAVAAALAASNGLELEIDPAATTFATDGKIMRMPPVASMLEQFPDLEDFETYLLGAVLHEGGHKKFTDRAAREAFHKMYRGHALFETARAIGQIVEDVVIERAQISDLVGARNRFLRLWKLLFVMKADRPEDYPEMGLVVDYVFYRARHSTLLAPWSLEAVEDCKTSHLPRLDPALVASIETVLEGLDGIQTTAHGAALSVRLLTILGIESNAKDENDQAGDADENSSTAEQGAEDQGSMDLAAGEPLDLIAIAVSQIMEECPEGTPVHVQMPGGETPLALAKREFEATHRLGMDLKQRVLTQTMKVSARLASLLNAQTESQSYYAKTGKIVGSRMWKLKSGNCRVFRKTIDGEDLDTSVKLLLDRSSSMEGDMQQAIEAACFLPLALNGIDGIETSIDFFPGSSGFCDHIKPFGASIHTCLDALAEVSADGSTPLTEALRESGADLLSQSCDRRILVVITDGRPDNTASAKQELLALEAQGVEVIGIGIGQGARISQLPADSVEIRNVSDLTSAICGLMERKLLKRPLAA